MPVESIGARDGETVPLVICSYCSYLGQGHTVEQMWEDVERHEQTCTERDDGVAS